MMVKAERRAFWDAKLANAAAHQQEMLLESYLNNSFVGPRKPRMTDPLQALFSRHPILGTLLAAFVVAGCGYLILTK